MSLHKPLIRRVLRALSGAVLALVAFAPAQAGDVVDVRFGAHGDFTRVVVETTAPVDFEAFTLAEPAERLVLTLPQAAWRVDSLPEGSGRGHGVFGAFSFEPTAREARLVFDLDAPAVIVGRRALPPAEGGGHRFYVDLAETDRAAFIAASGFPESPGRSITDLIARSGVTAPSCRRVRVVIDPGHGGRDPGAPGRFGGAAEAEINLAAGLELRDQLNATGRYDVIMTRETDVYLALEERVAFAQAAEADLFISLHADASPSGTRARGASVYTLAEYAEDRVVTRAKREGDWLISRGERAAYVNNILLNLAVREKRNQSLAFSQRLLAETGEVTRLWRDQPFERGLYVLLDSQIPTVLFEMGFLTNPDDSRMLNTAAGRARLMSAVVDSVDAYFERCGGGRRAATTFARLDAGAAELR